MSRRRLSAASSRCSVSFALKERAVFFVGHGCNMPNFALPRVDPELRERLVARAPFFGPALTAFGSLHLVPEASNLSEGDTLFKQKHGTATIAESASDGDRPKASRAFNPGS